MEISGVHHQLMASQSLEEVFSSSNTRQPSHLLHHQITQNQIPDNQQQQNQQNQQHQQHQSDQPKKPRPHPDQALKCPRCDSTNTKFCYYNNYSLSQPRYFCKGCRRYWTQGGSLRNVPVGGGCRKNKRASSSPRNSSPTPKKVQENPRSIVSNTNPNSNPNPNPLLSPLLPPGPVSQHSGLTYDPSDLSLAFACNLAKPSVPALHEGYANPSCFLDILRGGGFLENHSNAPTNSTGGATSIGGGFQGFYYGYGASGSNANVMGPVGQGTGQEMVLPAFDGSASVSGAAGGSVESGDAGGTVSGSDSLMVQGGNSCKAALDGGLQLHQQGGDGNENVSGTGNGLGMGNAFALESARDYWSSTVGSSSSWQSIVNSSML